MVGKAAALQVQAVGSEVLLLLPLAGALSFVQGEQDQDLQRSKDELTRVTKTTSHVDE